MTPEDVLGVIDTLCEAPRGIDRLRQLILRLAVMGDLVPQDARDESERVTAEMLASKRDALIEQGEIRKPRHPMGVDIEDPPYEVPASWTWLRLGDVGAIVGGGTPKTSCADYWARDRGTPWLTPADMRHNEDRYVRRGARDITEVGLSESSAQLLPAGTVLFSSRAPIGHVGIAANPLATNQGFKSCVPYISEMAEFIYVFLQKMAREIDAAATGTTFKEVSGRDVALIPVPIPPLAEQRRIVQRVDDFMAVLDQLGVARNTREGTRIALRDAALAALVDADTPGAVEVAWSRIATHIDDLTSDATDTAHLQQAIRQLAIQGQLVPQDTRDKAASVALQGVETQMHRARQDQEHAQRAPVPVSSGQAPFDVPRGWTWSRLGTLLREPLANGRSVPTKDGGFPVLRLSALRSGHVDLCDSKEGAWTAREARRWRVSPGDFFVARGNGSIRLVGRGALVCERDVPPVAFPDTMIRVRLCTGAIEPVYLACVWDSSTVRDQIESAARTTSGLHKISQADVRNVLIPVPPLTEQRRIVIEVGRIAKIIERLSVRLTDRSAAQDAFATAAVNAVF